MIGTAGVSFSVFLVVSKNMEFDWQFTLPSAGSADNRLRRLEAPKLNTGERILGYMLSLDAKDKVSSVNGVDISLLQPSGNTLILKSSLPNIEVIYRDEYLKTCGSKRICKCWYYPPCNCCVEDREYEFSEDEDDDVDLPVGYSPKEAQIVRHAVDGPTIWVLGSYKRW